MYLRLYILIFSALISVGIRPSLAEDKKSTTNKSNWSLPIRDNSDIYIDDGLEGSGNNQEMREDLESSGSGFGPDDEDGEGEEPVDKNKDKPTKTIFSPKEDQDRGILPVNTGPNKEVPDIDIDITNTITNRVLKEDDPPEDNRHGSGVIVMNTKHEERATSFFAQPGILAGGDCSNRWEHLIKNFSQVFNASENKPYKFIFTSTIELKSIDKNVTYSLLSDSDNSTTQNFKIDEYNYAQDDYEIQRSDVLFFKSLMPDLALLNVTQKLDFKRAVLQALSEILSYQ